MRKATLQVTCAGRARALWRERRAWHPGGTAGTLMIAASLWAQIATAQPARPQAPSVALDEVWAAASAGDRVFVGGGLLGVAAAADMQAGFAVVDRTTGQRVVNAALTGRNRLSTAIADGAGGYYVGGWFSGKPDLVRLRPDGTPDTRFDPSFYANPDWREGPPSALALVGNHLFVVRHVQYAPPFRQWQDCGESWLMVLDQLTGTQVGRSWQTSHHTYWNACANPGGNEAIRRIHGLVVIGDTVFAAGLFDHLQSPDTGDEISRVNIVAFDGVTGEPVPWPTSVGGGGQMVSAVSSEGQTLLLAVRGIDTASADIRTLNVSTRQESVWLSDPSLYWLGSVALIGGTAIFSGWFEQIAGQARWGLAAVDTSGTLLPWAPRANHWVYSLGSRDQTLYIAGEFSRIDGQTRLGAAAFDFSSGGTLTAWNPAASGRVRTVTPLASTAVLVGDFSATRATPRSSIAALDAATGTLLPWAALLADTHQRLVVQDLLVSDTAVFAKGCPSYRPGAECRDRWLKFDIATGHQMPFAPADNPDWALGRIAVSGNRLFASASVAGQPQLVTLDASTGAVLWSHPVGVEQLAASGEQLFVAGSFTQIGGVSRPGVARLDAATGTVLPFTSSGLEFLGDRKLIIGRDAVPDPRGLAADRLFNVGYAGPFWEWIVARGKVVPDGWETNFAQIPIGIAEDRPRHTLGVYPMGGTHQTWSVLVGTSKVEMSPYEPNYRNFDTVFINQRWPAREWAADGYISRVLTAGNRIIVAGDFGSVEGVQTPGLAIFPPVDLVPPSAPQAPRNFSAVVSGNRVRMTWDAALVGTPAASYVINASLSPGGPAIATLPAAASPLEVTAPNGIFYVTVHGLNAYGAGSPSNRATVAVGLPQPPTAPTLTVVRGTANPITLSWTPGPGATPDSYTLQAGTSAGVSNLGAFPMGLSTTVTAVAPVGVPIFARVLANGAGVSMISNEVTFAVAPPPAPTLGAPQVAGNTVHLWWTGAGPAYVVRARLEPGGAVVASLPVAGTSVVVPNVPAGDYYVTVVGVADGGTSPESNQVLVHVP